MGKVAVSAAGRDLESAVDARFGRCPYFVIVDQEAGTVRAVENRAASLPQGAGVEAARLVVEQGVEAVITGSVGPKAVPVLKAAGVAVYAAWEGTVREALERLARGELNLLSADQCRAGDAGPFGYGRRGG